MSKKHSRNRQYEDFEDDQQSYYENGYHDHLVQRRKLKKMKNALRTKNIDHLMELDDDY